MKIKNIYLCFYIAISLLLVSCENDNSVFDPEFELPGSTPEINLITPDPEYLAGVDSVIVTGENFSTEVEELVINFGGSPGVVLSATETELIVRPGVIDGNDLDVRVGVRGVELLSDPYLYTLRDPQDFYRGTDENSNPTTPIAVDAANNIYTIIDRNGTIRYTKIAPDGTITRDLVKYPGEPRSDPNDNTPYPADSTMRFTAYSDMEIGPDGKMYTAQQAIRAIFFKTFGDDKKDSIWTASTTTPLKIQDMIFDDNGYLWVVGLDSDQIHRFTFSNRAETKFSFPGQFRAVAYFDNENELFVGGTVNGSQQVWKFTIDGGGNLSPGQLYFDFGSFYDGNITSMIFASNGELLVGTTAEESIVRVFPDGKHGAFYPGMIKEGTFSITWRDDEIAIVGVNGENSSINFMDMFDRRRAGIFSN